MQKYFRSSINGLAITTGLFFNYGSAFATESNNSEVLLLSNVGSLERSLTDEPLRAPLPQKENLFSKSGEAYLEKDVVRHFLDGLKNLNLSTTSNSLLKESRSRSHKRVNYHRMIRQKNKV